MSSPVDTAIKMAISSFASKARDAAESKAFAGDKAALSDWEARVAVENKACLKDALSEWEAGLEAGRQAQAARAARRAALAARRAALAARRAARRAARIASFLVVTNNEWKAYVLVSWQIAKAARAERRAFAIA